MSNDNNELLNTDEILLEMTNLLEENNQNNICTICLDPNDDTSIKLDCGCNNKFHLKCVKLMETSDIKKCPLCNKKIFKNNTRNNNCININCINVTCECLLFLLYVLLLFFYMITIVATLTNGIRVLFGNNHNVNPCDNYYKKCDYYPTIGILTNNTINQKYYDFKIKYELSSSYSYGLNYEKSCINLESHEYDSLEETLKISKMSIGTKKKIYIPYNDKMNCSLENIGYEPNILKLNMISSLNFILLWIIPLIMHLKKKLERNQINIIKYFLHPFIKYLLYFVISITFLLSPFILYYIIKLGLIRITEEIK
jgi:hypothetical protein